MSFFVYQIFNLVNGKCYVGKTNNLPLRWTRHQLLARKDSNLYVHRAIRKYGVDAFEFRKIGSFVNEEEAFRAEEYWIDFFKSSHPEMGYNMTTGGEGFAGLSKTPEHRQKLREANLGKRLPSSQIEKIRTANSGANHPMFGKKGSKHQASKLSDENIRQIRVLLSRGIPNFIIAQQFNVGPRLIWQIKTNRSRADVQ